MTHAATLAALPPNQKGYWILLAFNRCSFLSADAAERCMALAGTSVMVLMPVVVASAD